ncbi:aminoacyl-histidine dipeptidase [Peptoniphilus stercorisuis]|uniref:Dipeptidase D n=1 Tax=Peptoniphilus stercorisuis TaxID=1436965 RepID=A0ABS4KEE1_9FIRM|nr:aminoacyl-histidine dipeptidase [Peptoniphilus stercorisuis]MBP2026133.1 dipeptidase D [Peptoniphilus stercorisuis]
MNLNVEPKEVFKWFYEINQIPRCSGDEKRISDFLVDFAKKRNLEVYQDEALNVIIKKEATKGYENSDIVIIQGHMDMVCVKEKDSDHNFDIDPIDMYIDEDFIKANGTTLGADDGIAVAMALAVLDSNEISHPKLEVLITTNEETNMGGASELKAGILEGNILLNIDSEEEGYFLVSCSGGASVETLFKIEKESLNKEGVEISIDGLLGGHSGSEIDRQRANAIILLGRILREIEKNQEILISEINGGIKHNAIPSHSFAKIYVEDINSAKEIVNNISKELQNEFRVEEKDLKVVVKDVNLENIYTKELSKNLINYIMTVPNGVISMSKDIDGLVETSLNNAIIEEKDGYISYITSVRSSSISELKFIIDKLFVIGNNYNLDVSIVNQYPAWQYEANSKVRDLSLKLFKDLFNKEAETTAIHAGIECGLLKGVLPDCDMISYGPDIFDAHTPKERISISSTIRMWEFTKELLKNLK